MRPQFGQYPHHYLTVCSISFYQPELVTARRGQHQSGIFSFAGGRLRAFHPAFPRPSTYRNTASGAADLSRLLACRAQHRSRSKVQTRTITCCLQHYQRTVISSPAGHRRSLFVGVRHRHLGVMSGFLKGGGNATHP